MLKGGYKIIDFQDVDITTENGAAVIGIYEEIEKITSESYLNFRGHY